MVIHYTGGHTYAIGPAVRPWFAGAIEWDEGNESELAAHHISPSEVEELCAGDPVWLPNKKHRAADWKIVGRTEAGRAISVVATWDETRAVLRPVTGWDCTAGEVKRYLGV